MRGRISFAVKKRGWNNYSPELNIYYYIVPGGRRNSSAHVHRQPPYLVEESTGAGGAFSLLWTAASPLLPPWLTPTWWAKLLSYRCVLFHVILSVLGSCRDSMVSPSPCRFFLFFLWEVARGPRRRAADAENGCLRPCHGPGRQSGPESNRRRYGVGGGAEVACPRRRKRARPAGRPAARGPHLTLAPFFRITSLQTRRRSPANFAAFSRAFWVRMMALTRAR